MLKVASDSTPIVVTSALVPLAVLAMEAFHCREGYDWELPSVGHDTRLGQKEMGPLKLREELPYVAAHLLRQVAVTGEKDRYARRFQAMEELMSRRAESADGDHAALSARSSPHTPCIETVSLSCLDIDLLSPVKQRM